MKSYVVVEGAFDAALVSTVIERFLPEQEIIVTEAGGKSSVVSLARSLLLTRKCPVILAVDADTVDQQAINEHTQDLKALLGMTADPSLWKVVLFVPAIEVTILQDMQFAETLFNGKLTPVQRALIPYDPKRVLRELTREYWSTENGSDVIRRLSDLDLTPLKEAPAIREILDFLAAVRHRQAA